MSDTTDQIQQYQTYMSYFVAANILVFAGLGLALQLPIVAALILQAILTATAFFANKIYASNNALSLDLSAIAIVLTPAVLVHMLAGHPWQLDAHMYFFAALAMTIAFKSQRAAIMAAAAVALHHLILNFALPYSVFPEGGDFIRVLFHAVIVIVETAVILLTVRGLQANDGKIMEETAAAKSALDQANEATKRQKEAEAKSEKERVNIMNGIASDFDNKIGGLISALASSSTELQATAESMRSVADKTSRNSETVSLSSQEASQNVNTVASAMEEMSASSSEIASQMSSVEQKSTDTATSASQANDTVENLDQLVDNIGEVVTAIQGIAEQTNLLALNATIEAARAGEAGKGFAVVADEVKKLANETSQKTEEISGRINDIQNATKESVDAMQRIITNVADIDHSVTSVSAAIEEQNATTSEIVRSVSDASTGVQQVSEVINTVQEGAEETGSSSDTVLTAASEVADLSEKLKLSVDEFLTQIRSNKS